MMSGGLMGIGITVFTLVIIGASFFFVFKMMKGFQQAAQDEQRLLATGQPATGQILAVQETGTRVNNQPQVVIVVMVTPPGGQPYQAQITKLISMFQIGQYQVGAQVQVRYDPMNPSKIALAPGGAPMMAAAPMMAQAPQANAWPGAPQAGMPPQGQMPPQGGGMPPGGGWPGQ